MIDIVIIGSGVAGLTAGIYAGRANKSVLIIEENNLRENLYKWEN